MSIAVAGELASAGPSAWWYLNRSTGVVTLVLLTASVVLGIVKQQSWQADGWPGFVVHRLHRNVSLLVMVFLGMHITASIIDGFAPIRLADAVVPFVSAYRPIWLGLGALVFDLLLAIVITSLVRKYLSRRSWRVVHYLTYAAWPIAIVHGLGTGTDTKQIWMLALTACCIAAVLVTLWLRAMHSPKLSEENRPFAYAVLLLAPLALVAWLPMGPLGTGWSARAGTPPALLSLGGKPTTASQEAKFDTNFSEPIEGTISRQADGGSVTVELDMNLTDTPDGVARVRLQGRSDAGGETRFTSGRASLGPASKPSLYNGTVKTIQNGNLHAMVADPAGHSLNVTIAPQVAGETLAGTIAAQPSATIESG